MRKTTHPSGADLYTPELNRSHRQVIKDVFGFAFWIGAGIYVSHEITGNSNPGYTAATILCLGGAAIYGGAICDDLNSIDNQMPAKPLEPIPENEQQPTA